MEKVYENMGKYGEEMELISTIIQLVIHFA